MNRLLRFLCCCWLLATAATAFAVQVPLSMPANAKTAKEVGVDEKLGGQIPLDLTFRDADNKQVRLSDLITVPTIIVPVYYSCPNVCSFLEGALARVLPQIKRTPNKDYRVISVSFNPRETSEDARKARAIYDQAMNHQFPMSAWRFLTGDQAAITALTDAAGYRYIPQGEDFLHPVAIFVVTKDGKISRYLYGTSILPMDLTLALVEAAQGRSSPAIRKVAQFCFSYDPKSGRYVFNIFRISATVILLTAGGFLAFLVLTGRRKRGESQKKP